MGGKLYVLTLVLTDIDLHIQVKHLDTLLLYFNGTMCLYFQLRDAGNVQAHQELYLLFLDR